MTPQHAYDKIKEAFEYCENMAINGMASHRDAIAGACKSALAVLPELMPVKVGDVEQTVANALHTHTMKHSFYGFDAPLPLVDMLCPKDDMSIERGREELGHLAENICGMIAALTPTAPPVQSDELRARLVEWFKTLAMSQDVEELANSCIAAMNRAPSCDEICEALNKTRHDGWEIFCLDNCIETVRDLFKKRE